MRCWSHAAAVVSATAEGTLEGLAHGVPVVAALDGGDAEVSRVSVRGCAGSPWPLEGRTVTAQIEQVARLLRGEVAVEALAAARGAVRIHGDEVEPGFCCAHDRGNRPGARIPGGGRHGGGAGARTRVGGRGSRARRTAAG